MDVYFNTPTLFFIRILLHNFQHIAVELDFCPIEFVYLFGRKEGLALLDKLLIQHAVLDLCFNKTVYNGFIIGIGSGLFL